MTQPSASPGSEDRTGLLVVRAWREDGSPSGFRARVTQVRDGSEPVETTAVVERVEALHEAVHQLVERLMRPVEPRGEEPGQKL